MSSRGIVSPQHYRPSLVEQIRRTTDAEIAAVLEKLAAATPTERRPRLLLAPNGHHLPLHDRAPDRSLLVAQCGIEPLLLPSALRDRLSVWSAQCVNSGHTLEILVERHRLAAEVQSALGPGTTVLFPEANTARSNPSPEDVAMAERIRVYKETHPV